MPIYESKLPIKSWAEEDRPREKLLLQGRQALTDAELIAILISSGSLEETAVELSRRILLTVHADLDRLARLSVKDLMKFKGIGEAKAISIVAALELGRRRKAEGAKMNDKITSSRSAYDYIYPKLADLQHEEFWILLLNRANRVMAGVPVSKGGVTGTAVDPKIVYKHAIEQLAVSIILCHNHPSGNLQPSQADINLTKQLREAGKFLDINILDHLIVTDNGYFSFADEGVL